MSVCSAEEWDALDIECEALDRDPTFADYSADQSPPTSQAQFVFGRMIIEVQATAKFAAKQQPIAFPGKRADLIDRVLTFAISRSHTDYAQPAPLQKAGHGLRSIIAASCVRRWRMDDLEAREERAELVSRTFALITAKLEDAATLAADCHARERRL